MTRTISIKKFLRTGLLGGLFVFIIGYSLFRTNALATGVSLSVESIRDGDIFHDGILTLTGTAVHATYLSINDKEIVIDEQNGFSEELVLSPGYNIITVEASDKFDQGTMRTYRVLYEESQNVAALPE